VYKETLFACSDALTPKLSVSLKMDRSHTSIINAQQPIVPKALALTTFDRITPDKVTNFSSSLLKPASLLTMTLAVDVPDKSSCSES
jgi:hypothetical protein